MYYIVFALYLTLLLCVVVILFSFLAPSLPFLLSTFLPFLSLYYFSLSLFSLVSFPLVSFLFFNFIPIFSYFSCLLSFFLFFFLPSPPPSFFLSITISLLCDQGYTVHILTPFLSSPSSSSSTSSVFIPPPLSHINAIQEVSTYVPICNEGHLS